MSMKIGTDIIQIQRIETLLSKYGDRFKERFLVEEEMNTIHKIESIAGYWAAKEAISKAFGCGIGANLSFHDIQITKDALGAPTFVLTPQARERHTFTSSSLSISHDGGFAIAVAVVVP
jgi:holo-[acyl-carrier protein] synthase